MRNYEVVFVAAPTLTGEELDAFIAHVHSVVEGKNGKVLKVENWGKRTLAYRIRKFRDAYYVVLSIEGDGAVIAELERRFRVTDSIIRFLSVRIDQDMKRAEKIKAARQSSGGRCARGRPGITSTGPGRGRPAGFSRARGPIETRSGNMAVPRRFTVRRKRVCKFCAEKITFIDYKDGKLLSHFIPERGKILPRRISGVCSIHQRQLSEAIKRARHLAIIPFVSD